MSNKHDKSNNNMIKKTVDGGVIAICQHLCTEAGTQKALADLLMCCQTLVSHFINKNTLDEASRTSEESGSIRRVDILIGKINETIPEISIDEDDIFSLDQDKFLQKIKACRETTYRKIIEKLGSKYKRRSDFDYHEAKADKICGEYIQVFLCQKQEASPLISKEISYALLSFSIERSKEKRSSSYIKIIQQFYPFGEDLIPEGSVKLKDDIIEIDLDYKDEFYPFGKIIAKMPTSSDVWFFVGLSLDVKASDRVPVLRPCIFLKSSLIQMEGYNTDSIITNLQGAQEHEDVCKAIFKIIDKNVIYDREKFETVIELSNSKLELKELIDALKAASDFEEAAFRNS